MLIGNDAEAGTRLKSSCIQRIQQRQIKKGNSTELKKQSFWATKRFLIIILLCELYYKIMLKIQKAINKSWCLM